MEKISLCGKWEMTAPDLDFGTVPANVPGSVYSDLIRAGLCEDPFYRDNEDKAFELSQHGFNYSRRFNVPESLLSCDKVFLRCEGLDTLAKVFVNGLFAGEAFNMHRIWEFDIKDKLCIGENDVEIRFSSPLKYIKEEYEKSPANGSRECTVGFPLIRKAHCMFGWDWGPRLPDEGIWRDISIIGVNLARIRDVKIIQHHSEKLVSLEVKTNITEYTGSAPVKVKVTSPDGKEYFAEGENALIEIENPHLWWPRGLGKQPLYSVSVTLGDGLDEYSCRVGLRTLTVSRKKDEFGEGFCHTVNGVDVFAMGADYVPEDSILSRVTPEKTRKLLETAAEANMNCIRVWGGGYYPDDFFYDICDELGLLVWQDFMFACANYNLTDEFEENIIGEITDNVRRIRHHASLALWCGNNEMELFMDYMEWGATYKQKSDYVRMYEHIIPHILKDEDTETFYWPASPSSGGGFDNPNDENRGDVHFWEVWHSGKPFTDYRNHLFRYVSEFGFQSFPCLETVKSFTKKEDRNPFSYVMEKHQRNASANGKILNYLSDMYLYPADFDKLIYASQLLQAQAMQYGVEHWRRHRGRCMGAVIWQLNDIWPVASWSGIDYFGRRTALHYYEKRFFAPVLISCCEEGTLTQCTDVNAEPFKMKKSARLNVSNETMGDFCGKALWSLRRPDGEIIQSGEFSVNCPALSAVWLPEQDFSEYGTYDCYYSYSLINSLGETVGEGSVLFCPPKHFKFENPCLTARIEGDEVVVMSSAFARSVEIDCGADTVLSDNYFDMNGGEKRIRIISGQAESVKVRSVYDIR